MIKGNRDSVKYGLMYILQALLHVFLIKVIWNTVLVKLFPTMKLPQITFWQALSISFLAGMLLGTNQCCAYAISAVAENAPKSAPKK